MTMVKNGAALLAAALAALFLLTGGSDRKSSVGYSALGAPGGTAVTGLTGLPLGEISTVEGVVVDGSATRVKENEGRLFLRLKTVNGKAPARETLVPLLFFPWAGVKAPAAGDVKKYTGYETGGFTGIPEKAFDYLPRVAAPGYHFETCYQVCKEL